MKLNNMKLNRKTNNENKEKTKKNAPFHVTSLGTAKSHDAIFAQNIQRQRIHALLVDDDEAFVVAVTHALLKLHQFAALVVGKFPF